MECTSENLLDLLYIFLEIFQKYLNAICGFQSDSRFIIKLTSSPSTLSRQFGRKVKKKGKT